MAVTVKAGILGEILFGRKNLAELVDESDIEKGEAGNCSCFGVQVNFWNTKGALIVHEFGGHI